MRRLQRLLRVLLPFMLLASTTAWAGHRRLSPELNDKLGAQNSNPPAGAPGPQQVDVIIQFRPGAKLSDGINKVEGAGGAHKSRLDVINGSVFHVPASMLPKLADDPDVIYISPDRKNIQLSPYDYILDSTGTNPVLQLGYSGAGVGIAVIDSGVSASHPDFSRDRSGGDSRVVYSQSFIPGLDASDEFGHGTAVAGLL